MPHPEPDSQPRMPAAERDRLLALAAAKRQASVPLLFTIAVRDDLSVEVVPFGVTSHQIAGVLFEVAHRLLDQDAELQT
jgi:hypothetical protein